MNTKNKTAKYSFSGHESFPCKSLWLKKGYDYMVSGNSFNTPEAVIKLGVGKNMVASIRYWLRAFGVSYNDKSTSIGEYLLDSKEGKDPYMEDLGTLWLLHFFLVYNEEATLYNWLFIHLQRERKTFERKNILSYVHRRMIEEGKQGLYNENTVKKDVGVLLQNYVLPTKAIALDDYSALLIDLELIRTSDAKNYTFNIEGKRKLPWQIFLYAILMYKGKDNTVSYDMLQEIGLIFCMNDIEVMEMCMIIEVHKPDYIRYSDTAGIRQLQFFKEINSEILLNEYYG